MKNKILNTFICLPFFLIPFYFFRFSFFGIKTNIFEIAVLMSLIVSLPFIYKNRNLKLGKDWILPAVFIVVALISVIIASDKEKALGIFKGWFLVPAIFSWLITKNFNKKDIGKIAIPLFVGLLIISVWAILQKFGFITTLFYQSGDRNFDQYIANGRSFGPFDSPNFLAMYLTAATFLSLPIIELVRSKWMKVLTLFSFLIPVLALYFSGSRAGYITFFIGLLILINYRFINLQKTENRKPFFTASLVLLFLIINIGYLFFSTHNFKPASDSDRIRIEIYGYGANLIQKHPVFGLGLGQFQSAIGEISKNNLSFQAYGLPYALHPHNLFLALWLNLGIAGLIIFIWLVVLLFRGLYFNDSKYKAYFIAAAFAILIHGLFDTTYFKNDLSTIFWLIFACSIILGKNETKHENI